MGGISSYWLRGTGHHPAPKLAAHITEAVTAQGRSRWTHACGINVMSENGPRPRAGLASGGREYGVVMPTPTLLA